MKKLTVGILAHVDSGKTTLSEALLYLSGKIRKLGRVDHKDAYLDTYSLEKSRGITIFSKQAILSYGDTEITLLDTPGHVDFSPEAERVLAVLDAAVLVISGTSGVQSHTETLWHLLSKHNIPTIIFVNKMDMPGADRETLMSGIRKKLSSSCIEEDRIKDYEETALCSEVLMEKYLANAEFSDSDIQTALMTRSLFPVFFGSALKTDGVENLLRGLDTLIPEIPRKEQFGARIFKITHDETGTRLTHMKITGGKLAVRSTLSGVDNNDEQWEEKVDRIRLYSGSKFTFCEEATAGTVCAVTGLTKAKVGDGLGFEKEQGVPVLEPVLNYRVNIPPCLDIHTALTKIRSIEEEEPLLHTTFDENTKEIHVLLMGEIQLEVLRHIINERFGFEVTFGEGSIVYRETINGMVEGVGHYEPLRHYSEVHLLLEGLERGSGLIFATDCDTNSLDRNWQRLILTHLEEKTHRGVLTGSPITDMKITLVAGRASKKHTEGGDFREATYRAVRQGLMKAQSVLLEPWYDYELKIPTENVGRAMSDIQRMGGTIEIPDADGDISIICGTCPVSEMRSYSLDVASYTHGKGVLTVSLRDYEECHNSQEIIENSHYIADLDVYNTADSVFCAGGAGFLVKWNEVEKYMHLESVLATPRDVIEEQRQMKIRAAEFCAKAATDSELMEIFERTYGKIKRRDENKKVKFNPSVGQKAQKVPSQKPSLVFEGPEYLLIDGYNIIFAWDELKKLSLSSLDSARNELINRMCNYQGFCGDNIILVFDAYKVKKNPGAVEKFRNINVVYTKEAETADTYIERVSHQLSKKHRVKVATSDGPEQMIILGNGALRIPAGAFRKEVGDAERAIREFLTEG